VFENFCRKDKLFRLILSKLFNINIAKIFYVDVRGIILLVSREAAKWLNKEKNKLVGTSIYDHLSGLDDLKFALSRNTVMVHEQQIDDSWYKVRIIPVNVRERVYGAIIKYDDITDYKKLQEVNKELDAVIEATSDSIYVTDGEGNTLRINSACERITGLRKDVVIGMNMREIVEKGMISASCTLEVLRTKSPTTILQRVKDGKVVIVTGTPIFDENGRIWRVVSCTRDITELNRLKNELEWERRWKDQYFSELVNTKVEHLSRGDGTFIARSEEMKKIVELAMRVARTDSTVLVMGESGVGKEVIAKFIHENGPRRKKAFMKINCAAIPESLLESELFGYEPGAFTGAISKGKNGLIELADGGTLFLDEIGEMPLALQAKLLQVLQERTFFRVGGNRPIEVDIRIIAATNRDLKKLVAEGKFREDLYYRLNVIPIFIPPLRERREDIPLLIFKFLKQFNSKYGLCRSFSNEAVDLLTKYSWPGNVRELQNLVEQMVVLACEDVILPEHLPDHIRNGQPKDKNNKINISGIISFQEAVEEVEKQLFLSAYERCHNTYQTAKMLGVSQPTVVRKLKKYRASITEH
jgi:PAS domain S-box-containing protein